MGFLKDMSKLTKMGNEMQKNSDPAARMREATAQMAAMNNAAVGGNLAMTQGIDATATIVSATQTGAMINFNPAVHLELLVTIPGMPPLPVSHECVVMQLDLARCQEGATLPVKVLPTDPSQLWINW